MSSFSPALSEVFYGSLGKSSNPVPIQSTEFRCPSTRQVAGEWGGQGAYTKYYVHKLVHHVVQVMEMAWTDDRILAIFLLHAIPVASIVL